MRSLCVMPLSFLLRAVAHLPPFDPLALGLAGRRGEVVKSLADRCAPERLHLEPGVLARDPQSLSRYDRLIADVVDELRNDRPSGLRGTLAALDRAFYRDDPELLDDPSYPEKKRIAILRMVKFINDGLGSYQRWGDLLQPTLDRLPRTRPVTIHDVAAGHGMFGLAMKRRWGGRVEVTVSDLAPEYLEMGQRDAAAEGLSMHFVQQDATDLRGVEGFDVLVCTQSIHHFPPGMVARILGEAARVARVGVWLIDAERNALAALALGALAFAQGKGAWGPLHDTVVSLRRMYVQEELDLLARLAPAVPKDMRPSTGRIGPGFAWVCLQREAT